MTPNLEDLLQFFQFYVLFLRYSQSPPPVVSGMREPLRVLPFTSSTSHLTPMGFPTEQGAISSPCETPPHYPAPITIKQNELRIYEYDR